MRSVSAAFVIWLLTLSLLGGAQLSVSWAQDPSAAENEDSEPTTEAANAATDDAPGPRGYALLQAAHKLSLQPADKVDYDEIVKMCEVGLSGDLSGEQEQYGNNLLAWALNRAGEAKAAKGDETGAFADFQRAISLKPDSWRAVHNRAVNFAVAGKSEEAMDDFNKTIELNPKYANAYFNRGELHYDQGRYSHAIADYNKALELTVNDSSALNSRGHAYYQLGRYRDALNDYSRALRADPRNASALTNRADAYADMGDFGRAAADYREAIRIDPKLGRAYLGAAWLSATCPDRRFRNPAVALEAARKSVELDGDKDYHYLDVLAAALADSGNFDEAVATQSKALELAGTGEDAKLLRQRLELYQKKQPYRSPAGPRTNNPARFTRGR